MTVYYKAPAKNLKKGDVVVFSVGGRKLTYEVVFTHLRILDKMESNECLFKLLGVDSSRHQMASAAYGYPSAAGLWPCAAEEDYPALTRFVRELFKYIESGKWLSKRPKPKKFAVKNKGKAIAAYLKKNPDAFGCQKKHAIELLSIMTGTDINHHMIYGGK